MLFGNINIDIFVLLSTLQSFIFLLQSFLKKWNIYDQHNSSAHYLALVPLCYNYWFLHDRLFIHPEAFIGILQAF